MMKHLTTILTLLWAGAAQAGIGDMPPPEAYLDPIDREIARTGQGTPERPAPCTRASLENGVNLVRSIPTDQCVTMFPARRWRGLWLDEFEGSRLCPEPARECTSAAPGDRIWLTGGRGSRSGALYAIDFIGRRTVHRGAYGHFGLSDHEMIVDRIISITPVQPAPAPSADTGE